MTSKFAHDLTHVQPVKHIWLTNKQKLEQKLGEALGVEMATQKAVEELSSKGLLQQGEMKSKLDGIKQKLTNL